MRNAILIILLLSSPCLAGDARPTMSAPPPEETIVESLLETLSSALSNKDFRQYMNCFTPQRASASRKKLEDVFICGESSMEVLDSFVIHSDEESIEFGVKYTIGDKSSFQKKTFCSKVVAKKHDQSWLIDSESVRSVVSEGGRAASSERQNASLPPVQMNCTNGRCPPPGPAQRTYPNPANGGEEAWLPRDIGYTPGPSCANGQCRIK